MKAKEFTENEQELYEMIYDFAVTNSMVINSLEAVTRNVIKDLKDRAKII